MNIDNTNIRIETVTILNGQNDSEIIDQHGRVLVGIVVPSSIDGTQLSFRVSTSEQGSFNKYVNSLGDEILVEQSENDHIGLLGDDFSGTQYFKLRSVTVTTSDRIYKLVMKGYGGA